MSCSSPAPWLLSGASIRYRAHLREANRTAAMEEKDKGKRELEAAVASQKKKLKSFNDVCQDLDDEATNLAEQAETKSGKEQTRLIVRSNALRRRLKEKLLEKENLEKEIASLSAQLLNEL